MRSPTLLLLSLIIGCAPAGPSDDQLSSFDVQGFETSDTGQVVEDLPDRFDHELIAEYILTDRLTDEQFERYQFSEDEMRSIVIEVGLASGGDFEELRTFAEKLDFKAAGDAPPPSWGACSQTVEKSDASGDTYAYTSGTSYTCDGDSSDVDYVFSFAPTWADDPNDVRWYANAYVRTVFAAAYSSNLLGSSLCSTPVQLCIGTTGVTAAGGASYVKSKLFISHL